MKRPLLQTLTRDFETLQMKLGESITDFFTETLGIASKMRSNGGTMEEVKVVEKILRLLTPKIDYIVCSVEGSKNFAELRTNKLQSFLSVHEQKLNCTTASVVSRQGIYYLFNLQFWQNNFRGVLVVLNFTLVFEGGFRIDGWSSMLRQKRFANRSGNE